MRFKKQRQRMILFLLMIMVFLFTTGFSYLDPGTGSLLIQVVIAGVIAGVAAIKRFGVKIFRLGKKRKEEK